MGLTRLAVVRPLTMLMGLLALVIMGGVSYTFLKIDHVVRLAATVLLCRCADVAV